VPSILLVEKGAVTGRALVDDVDYARLSHLGWHPHRSDTNTYARCNWVDGQRTSLFLHRAVLDLDPADDRRVDHRNRDTLDCRRANLRIVTAAQNAQNQGSRTGSSRFRGVTWDKSRRKWMANAQLDGRKVTIGRYATELEAACAARHWRLEHMPYTIEEVAA
jgi:hypothetical protein